MFFKGEIRCSTKIFLPQVFQRLFSHPYIFKKKSPINVHISLQFEHCQTSIAIKRKASKNNGKRQMENKKIWSKNFKNISKKTQRVADAAVKLFEIKNETHAIKFLLHQVATTSAKIKALLHQIAATAVILQNTALRFGCQQILSFTEAGNC